MKSAGRNVSYYWGTWIALYTGMRIDEICKLRIGDIREIEGIRCFSVNEESTNSNFSKHVKTMAELRKVPIHPWLWNKCGLGALVKERQKKVPQKDWAATPLFVNLACKLKHSRIADPKLSAPMTSWFMRYRRSLGIGGDLGEQLQNLP